MVEAREMQWVRLRKDVSKVVNYTFADVLAKKNINGMVAFSHKEETLEFRVSPSSPARSGVTTHAIP